MLLKELGFVGILSSFIIFSVLPAVAADDCAESSGDVAIAACTRRIDSGQFKGRNQAINYFNRGFEYDNKGDYDRAIADYNQAINLDPKYAKAYNNRGNAYYHKGDYDRAIADYNQAINLDSKYAKAYNSRGSAYDNKGDDDRAIADYDRAISLNPKMGYAYLARGLLHLYGKTVTDVLVDFSAASSVDPKDAYFALWLDIVGHRSNVPSKLAQATEKLDMKAWPAPVIRLFLGQTTPAAVFAAADHPDALKKKGQICEANFYTGELSLRNGLPDEATRLFTQAANDCPTRFLERRAANAELKALGATANPSTASRIFSSISGLFGGAKTDQKSASAVDEKDRIAAVVPPISSTGRQPSGIPEGQPGSASGALELPSVPGCSVLRPTTGKNQKNVALFAAKDSDAVSARKTLSANGWKITTDELSRGPDYSTYLLKVKIDSVDIVVFCGVSSDTFVQQGKNFGIFR
jgi:lipoprotein NlpI